ncbi:60S ribosomal protein L9 [Striga asiatica]|uniref:60S ribosomal protein L9 n=1 Tax=Striga asiatica TaxID=4170 RepID=A0A5A7RHJ4_STRAF|nr:60S ribosomal protein L9 [Striga asiatica]
MESTNGESSGPSLVQVFHSSPRWRLHYESTKQLMWAATRFRPQLAFDRNSATDGGGFLGHMVWTVQDDGTAAIPTALNHVTNLINGIAKGRRYACISGGGKTIEICNFLGQKRVFLSVCFGMLFFYEW